MRYWVYVIELSRKVFTENTKFRVANPQFNGVLECLYVGMTSKTPAERFMQHQTGYGNKKGTSYPPTLYKIREVSVSKFVRAYKHKVDDKGRGVDNGRKTCLEPEETGLCGLV